MATSQEKWDTNVLMYGRACMLDKKENYYSELGNTITTFNDNNNTPLSNGDLNNL